MSCHRDEDDRNQTDMQLLQVSLYIVIVHY